MASNSLLKGLKPMHPGEMLREDVLPALGKTKTEIASLLGISRQTLFDILSEKQPITPAMALRFGKLLGNGPDLWIDLQRAYDLHAAEKQLVKVLAKIPTIGRRNCSSVMSTRRSSRPAFRYTCPLSTSPCRSGRRRSFP